MLVVSVSERTQTPNKEVHMKRAMFLFVVILFSASVWTFASGQGKICIQIRAPTTQVVLGEPLFCTMTWENRGGLPITIAYTTDFLSPIVKPRLQGPLNAKCAAPKEFVE